ncbi:DUF6587 family protein [Coralloluteibacterium thermophilus]|uniref:DUF6587 family protein n=1 Tax=Coralloluteibacterium thermophilum TaxID=2707049 RepID=A0ABV9NIL5_9GAMM
MDAYALVEMLVVGAAVGASACALLLRWLPRRWLRAPLGRLLDRPGRPPWLRRLGARWHAAAATPGCASGCEDCSPACAAHAPPSRDPTPSSRRIGIRLDP